MVLKEEPASTSATVIWQDHPRLQRHVHRLQAHQDSSAVIERYRCKASVLSRQELLRYTVHVAAWVALLPRQSAVLGDCAQLLSFLLCTIGHAKLSTWLHGTLHLVALRLRESCRDASCQTARQWLELKESMSVWRDLRMKCPSLPVKTSAPPSVSCERPEEQDTTYSKCTLHRFNLNAVANNMSLKVLRQRQKSVLMRGYAVQGREKESAVEAVVQRATAALNSSDPESMVKSVVEAVGLLSAPRNAAVEDRKKAPMTEVAKRQLLDAQQARLRTTLLFLLAGEGALDMSDPGTQKLLAIPLERLKNMLPYDLNLDHIASRDQWMALAHAVGLHHGEIDQLQGKVPPLCERTSDSFSSTMSSGDLGDEQQAEPVLSKRQKLDSRGQFSQIIHGAYEPSARIKATEGVMHCPTDTKELLCIGCSFAISASWYFVHPRTGCRKILVPHNGHFDCKRLHKKGYHFKSTDGTSCKRDSFINLDFCEHVKERYMCVPCGGSAMCKHGKQRQNCKHCQHLVKKRKHLES